MGEEKKQKQAEALKGIRIYEFKNCFEPWKKNILIGVLLLNGEYFDGDLHNFL